MKLSGKQLAERADRALARLESCDLCPRNCGVNRLEDELGFCRTGRNALLSSYGPHFGEEAPLVGAHGSGTIFFAGCNLGCIFCQNYDISHLLHGAPVTAEELVDVMLELQRKGCHNINFVSPSHVAAQMLEALAIAHERGLRAPLVYNCGGYDSLETLKLLDGVIDIYMPDAKYADEKIAMEFSRAPNYPEIMKAALKEMHRQVGDLEVDERGVAVRGMLIRHLVLPNGLAGTQEIVQFIARELSVNSYVNVMAQYHPVYMAYEHRSLNRRITRTEYLEALDMASASGLHRGF
ncbi:MAG: radical SAM protein [Candidatus Abyssobacteria bacterium SURF_17]|jgi:putative pyruvate formate lyase activating enzyme|uniref:Radical SAM protein n=1 Tax=Candidatus Abyssobacteria bacterium SURF_17 TaxID=2093361 RepID=A0A419EV66_9BACT|nr:MAG: radical SAM protein [Candidatus Abyssubacteria bacterium SURF_17]